MPLYQETLNELDRDCPIIVRVPDCAPWLMTAYGLDIERWCRDDLVDGLMLNPFPRTIEDANLYPEHHIETGHKYNKYVIGGISSLNLMRNQETCNQRENTGFHHDKPVYEKAVRQYRDGADAMSMYQTEPLARIDYSKSFLAIAGNTAKVIENSENMADPDPYDLLRNNSSTWSLGLDWHSTWCHPKMRRGESLSTVIAENSAL